MKKSKFGIRAGTEWARGPVVGHEVREVQGLVERTLSFSLRDGSHLGQGAIQRKAMGESLVALRID